MTSTTRSFPAAAACKRSRVGILLGALAILASFVTTLRAGLDGTTPADRASDIDWPMYEDPLLPEIPFIRVYEPKLIPIWKAALARPDVDTRRRAIFEIGTAAVNEMPGLAEFIKPINEQMDARDAHPALILAAGRTLIQLDAKQSATSLLLHNERGGASGIIRGGTIAPSTENAPRHGGIEFVLLSDPALARWNHEPAIALWMRRLADPVTSPLVRCSAIDALREMKHQPCVDELKEIVINPRFEPASVRLHATRAMASLVATGLEDFARPLTKGATIDRLVAATLLSRQGGEGAIAVLTELAADAEPAVATVAIERLLELDPALLAAAPEKLIRSADATIRHQAARAIAARKTGEAIRLLAPSLDDLSPALRYFVRDRFIEFDKEESLRPVVRDETARQIAVGSWRALEQAAVICGRIDHEPAAPRLIELLPHRRAEVRIAAIIALRRIGLSDAAMLDAITAHTDREADAWLAAQKHAQTQTHLPQMRTADRDRELAQLMVLLGRARHARAAKVMERFIAKDSGFWAEGRSGAIWALGLLNEDKPDDRLAGLFIARLSDLDPTMPELLPIRRAAAISVGRMKAESGLKGLQTFYDMERTSRHIGGSCRWALIRITGKDLPPLDPREVSDTGWFIQPLESTPQKKK